MSNFITILFHGRDQIKNSDTFSLIKDIPSFSNGVTSIVDFRPIESKFNVSENENQADTDALRSDWRMVGQDINNGIKEYAGTTTQ